MDLRTRSSPIPRKILRVASPPQVKRRAVFRQGGLPAPPGMAVYAVSPGSAPDTKAVRNAGPAMKWLMIPLVKRHPHFHDRANQEAAWQAVVNASGVDLS